MGQSLGKQNAYCCSFEDYSSSDSDSSCVQERPKRYVTSQPKKAITEDTISVRKTSINRRQNSKNNSHSGRGSDSEAAWRMWERGEYMGKRERIERKKLYEANMNLDDVRKGCVVFDQVRGPTKMECEDQQTAIDRQARRNQRYRRQRLIRQDIELGSLKY